MSNWVRAQSLRGLLHRHPTTRRRRRRDFIVRLEGRTTKVARTNSSSVRAKERTGRPMLLLVMALGSRNRRRNPEGVTTTGVGFG
jgi:hypothetical protein